ncbi:MAG: hypothetical protein Q4G54_05070 [Pelistega sp.]|nr:hypothetical protein [Pelistega sp.]
MKLSRKLALVVLPLAAVLAGCQTTGSSTAATDPAAQTQQQGAAVEVYAASDRQVTGYRPVRISEQQVIYVAQEPTLTRAHLTAIEPIQDNQGRHFVRLGLNAEGVNALGKVPQNQGYVTVIGGQVASLSGVTQGTDFMFLTRDAQTAQAIVGAVAGQQAQ